jgi:hypothetical protein
MQAVQAPPVKPQSADEPHWAFQVQQPDGQEI